MKTKPFEPAVIRGSEGNILFYLEVAMEGNDAAHIARVRRDVARSKGMTAIVKSIGLRLRLSVTHAAA